MAKKPLKFKKNAVKNKYRSKKGKKKNQKAKVEKNEEIEVAPPPPVNKPLILQSLMSGRLPIANMSGPIKRGLLWQQRDRLFSRWKERYFVLTRDYLHCFKRATGNERASDMGEFIFKIKLVDVEKVEWSNRRSYSVISLFLGREGSVLLRCNTGLEEWFELLEECTIVSKQRRLALKLSQSPRSRASLAIPISHASLEMQHCGLGGSFTSAIEDWRNAINGCCNNTGKLHNTGTITNKPMLFTDSMPDFNMLKHDSHNFLHCENTNKQTATPKMGFAAAVVGKLKHFQNNALLAAESRQFVQAQVCDEESDVDAEVEAVQLRRPHMQQRNKRAENVCELDENWQYCKPLGPNEKRHSAHPMLPVGNKRNQINTKCELYDSGFETPTATTQRPSSYRELTHVTCYTRNYNKLMNGFDYQVSKESVRRSLQNPLPSQDNAALHGARLSVQERFSKLRKDAQQLESKVNLNCSNHKELRDASSYHYLEAVGEANGANRRASIKSNLNAFKALQV